MITIASATLNDATIHSVVIRLRMPVIPHSLERINP
jgi:hypothetical protein